MIKRSLLCFFETHFAVEAHGPAFRAHVFTGHWYFVQVFDRRATCSRPGDDFLFAMEVSDAWLIMFGELEEVVCFGRLWTRLWLAWFVAVSTW